METLEANPRDPDALSLLATIELQEGDREKAEHFARAAVDHAPQEARFSEKLAHILAVSGKAEQAIAVLEEAVRRHPDELFFRFELGRCLFGRGLHKEAIAILRGACAHAPKRPVPYSYLALALFRLKRSKEAIGASRKALALGESRSRALSALGKYLLDVRAAREARVAFSRAIQGDPNDLDSCSGLSRACAMLGDTEAARKAARELFSRCPIYVRKSADSVRRILLLEYLYEGFFEEHRYGPNIFAHLNFVSGLQPNKLSLHHYYLNREDPVGDIKGFGQFHAVINNVANSEQVQALGLAPIIRGVIDATGAPALNPPEAILKTTRAANYDRLVDARGFVFPKTIAVQVSNDQPEVTGDHILKILSPPLILRPAWTHAGRHASLAQCSEDVMNAVRSFAGELIYAIEYHECRDTDGVARRYRLACIGGDLIPVNMHASYNWNVHGDLRMDKDWHERGLDDIERGFLENPTEVVGGDPAIIFGDIVQRTPLDIFGFDFAITSEHRPIVFEINSSMSFSTRRLLNRFPYLRSHNELIQRKIEALVEARIRGSKAT
jgi:tetratricopeptide (TPR) repeat protein